MRVTPLGHGAMEIRRPRIWGGRPVTDRQAERILKAIFAEDETPEQWKSYIELNRQFFVDNPGVQACTSRELITVNLGRPVERKGGRRSAKTHRRRDR